MASTLDKPPRKDMTARAGADDSVSGWSRRTWRDRLSWFDFKASPYLYISPFFLLFALTGLFPLIYTVFVAMHDWDLLSGQGQFVGFANFTTTLDDRFFWNSIENTVSIFPVSYTHLRAHETRHDLVCRLLLEKKKNIKKETLQD